MKIQNISLTTLTTVLNKVKRNGILTILFLVASLSTTLVMMSFRNPHDKNTFRNVNGVDVGVELVPIFFLLFYTSVPLLRSKCTCNKLLSNFRGCVGEDNHIWLFFNNSLEEHYRLSCNIYVRIRFMY